MPKELMAREYHLSFLSPFEKKSTPAFLGGGARGIPRRGISVFLQNVVDEDCNFDACLPWSKIPLLAYACGFGG